MIKKIKEVFLPSQRQKDTFHTSSTQNTSVYSHTESQMFPIHVLQHYKTLYHSYFTIILNYYNNSVPSKIKNIDGRQSRDLTKYKSAIMRAPS